MPGARVQDAPRLQTGQGLRGAVLVQQNASQQEPCACMLRSLLQQLAREMLGLGTLATDVSVAGALE